MVAVDYSPVAKKKGVRVPKPFKPQVLAARLFFWRHRAGGANNCGVVKCVIFPAEHSKSFLLVFFLCVAGGGGEVPCRDLAGSLGASTHRYT